MTDASTKRHSRKGLYAPFIVVLVALAAWTGQQPQVDLSEGVRRFVDWYRRYHA